MEQKRKVKNLISCNRDGSFLTIVLLAIWMLFCLWSLWLMSVSFAWASNESEDNIYNYSSWIDDKVEVLYNVELLDGANSVRSKLSIDWVSLKIDSVPLIISGRNHVISPTVYSNILWWEANKVYSNNITILGWEDVYISNSNDDAAILWWMSNTMDEWKWTPLVLIWGKNNEIEKNHDGVGIIWWSGNVIKNWSKNSFILWWEWNLVNWNNVIVWWKDVTVQWLNNVFVFSDSEFTPEMWDAFYLNVGSWVWVNAEAKGEWLMVNNGIALSSISASSVCNDDSLWLIWLMDLNVYGCLVWCTKASAAKWQWELLDYWDDCNTWCASRPYCYNNTTQSSTIENNSYASYCLDNVNTGHAVMCFPVLDGYENVAFQSSLIDSDEECPDMRENKCIFRCEEWLHLTWNIAGNNQSDVHCFADCKLPWDETKKILHNETVEAYNIKTGYCSNDDYIFPKDNTKIVNFPDSNYEVVNNKVDGWTSYESCTNYDHKKTLVCNEGVLYLANKDGKTASTKKAEDYGYRYESCTLNQYRCPTDKYNLTQSDIINKLKDPVQDTWPRWWNDTDRWITEWVRWRYELCVDWDVDNWNESCNPPDSAYHYRFLGCQDGFVLDEDGVCRAQCTTRWGGSKTINHGQTWVWYSKTAVFCPDTCSEISEVYSCNDGELFKENWEKIFRSYNPKLDPDYTQLIYSDSFSNPDINEKRSVQADWPQGVMPVYRFICIGGTCDSPNNLWTSSDGEIVYYANQWLTADIPAYGSCHTRDDICETNYRRWYYDQYYQYNTNWKSDYYDYYTITDICQPIYGDTNYGGESSSMSDEWTCTQSTHRSTMYYRTTWCEPWYHMNYLSNLRSIGNSPTIDISQNSSNVCVPDEQVKKCAPKPDHSNWVWKAANDYVYAGGWGIWRYNDTDEEGYLKIPWWDFRYNSNGQVRSTQTLHGGAYVDYWEWEWDSCRTEDNCYRKWHWPADDDCKWECDQGDPNSIYDDYHQEGEHTCVKNGACWKVKDQCLDWEPASESETDGDRGFFWKCKWDGWTTDSCHLCNDGYTWDEDKQRCVRNLDGECSTELYECIGKDLYTWGQLRRNTNSIPLENPIHEWECKGSWTWKNAFCHQCFQNYEYNEDTGECIAMTRTGYCETEEENTVWVHDGEYSQVWSGDGTDAWWDGDDWLGRDGWYWDPSYESEYNPDGTWWLCDFDCEGGYERLDGVCKPITWWSCGRYPKHYDCVAWTGEGGHEIDWWWSWICKWTPMWASPTCIECDNWYRLEGETCLRVDCNYCAWSGFPYCFPIDFSDDCIEVGWCDTENWYYDEGGVCVKAPCNHCAKNGLPYCFPIDLRADCSEGLWLNILNISN